MNDSAASVKIASGMPKVTATTMGVSALGRMWRPRSRWKPAPSPRAASTYSFSLMISTWARVCRAMPTQPVRPMAMKMFVSPAPSIDMTRMTKSSRGKAYMTSMKRVRATSARPPRYPDRAPIGTPMATTMICAPRPTSIETRAPKIMRESRSRPSWSVPSG